MIVAWMRKGRGGDMSTYDRKWKRIVMLLLAVAAIAALSPRSSGAHSATRHSMFGRACLNFDWPIYSSQGLYLGAADLGNGSAGGAFPTGCALRRPEHYLPDTYALHCVEIRPVFGERPARDLDFQPTHMLWAKAQHTDQQSGTISVVYIKIHDRFPEADVGGLSARRGSGYCGADDVPMFRMRGDFVTWPD